MVTMLYSSGVDTSYVSLPIPRPPSPRPVLSNRPLRRPSSAADKGRLDELLAQAEAVKDEVGDQMAIMLHEQCSIHPCWLMVIGIILSNILGILIIQ